MRRVRENTSIPLATNTVVVNFEQLAANVRDPAVDVILLDTTFWGGIRACIKAAGVCETFQLGVAVHSSGELGIQLATMLHLGAVVPNLSFAADAHYHHLRDDIIAGGKLPYVDGAIARAGRTGPRRRAGPRQARRVRRAVPRTRPLSLRPGPGPARLVPAAAEHRLGRPSCRRAAPPARRSWGLTPDLPSSFQSLRSLHSSVQAGRPMTIPRSADLASDVLTHTYDDMFNPPGLTNFLGTAQVDLDVFAIRSVNFPPYSHGDCITGQLYVDGRLARSYGGTVEVVWRPDHVVRRPWSTG